MATVWARTSLTTNFGGKQTSEGKEKVENQIEVKYKGLNERYKQDKE